MPPGYSNVQTRIRNGITIDQNSNYWIAFDRIGLGKYDGTTWTMYDSTNLSLPTNKVTGVVFDESQNRIVASTGKGLSIYDGSTWQHFDNNNSLLPAGGATCAGVINNIIYAGTNSGVFIYDGTTWSSYSQATSGLANDSVTCISFGVNEEAWIGTRNGISRFFQNTWTTFSSANTTLSEDYIKSIVINGNNELWITNSVYSCYYLDSATADFVDLYNILPVSENACTGFSNKVLSQLAAINNEVALIITDPNQYSTSPSHRLLLKIDVDHKINCSPFSPTTAASMAAFLICRNNSLALVSSFGFPLASSYFFTGVVSGYSFSTINSTYINHDFLDVNNVSALILNRGDMHWDPVSQTNHYTVPKCGTAQSVFTSAIWLGGYDQNNVLHTAAQTYRQQGSYDFWTGPIDTITGTVDSLTVAQYDRLWKLNRTTLNDFIYNYQAGNVTNGTYEVPEVILNWPAHGSGNFTRNLAPFFDNNNDGNYDPYDGDYPDITGDQQLWWVFNDIYGAHTETDGPAFGFEIHGKAYAFNCDSLTSVNEPINYTTFYQYKIINRSQNTYNNMYIGLWVDNDLGNAGDDYLGCNIPLNSVICYNGDIDDDGANGYGLKPPSQNITLLKGPLADANDGIDNNRDGVIDEAGETIGLSHFIYYRGLNADPQGQPSATDDYYQYLDGVWLDGVPLTYGETGRNQGNPPCNFMFPGSTDTSFATPWTMPGEGLSSGDMRFISSTGKFTIAPGEERTVDFAYIYSRDTVGNWPADAEAKNLADIYKISYWFKNGLLSSCPTAVSVNENKKQQTTLSVHPVPADKYISVNQFESLKSNNYIITDITGKECLSGKLVSNKIDVASLSTGTYLLQLVNETAVFTAKFVKQ